MQTLIISIISVGCAVSGALIGIFTYRRNLSINEKNKENEIKQSTEKDTQEKVQLNAKLDAVLSNNVEIKGIVKDMGEKFDKFKDDFGTRLTRVEESCKFAHTKIDKIVNEKKKG